MEECVEVGRGSEVRRSAACSLGMAALGPRCPPCASVWIWEGANTRYLRHRRPADALAHCDGPRTMIFLQGGQGPLQAGAQAQEEAVLNDTSDLNRLVRGDDAGGDAPTPPGAPHLQPERIRGARARRKLGRAILHANFTAAMVGACPARPPSPFPVRAASRSSLRVSSTCFGRRWASPP